MAQWVKNSLFKPDDLDPREGGGRTNSIVALCSPQAFTMAHTHPYTSYHNNSDGKYHLYLCYQLHGRLWQEVTSCEPTVMTR